VISEAPENAPAEAESTMLSSRGGVEVYGSTGKYWWG